MEKRTVTMKDIAKEANVSVATVSYVLNYSEKEKISHDTRIRVFEAAKKLDYVPNMVARTLAGQVSSLVGIIINLSNKNKHSKIYQYYDIVNELQRILRKKGYDAVILSTKELDTDIEVVSKRALDGVFIIDMDSSSVKAMTNHYYVPLIIIEGYLEDNLFYKILSDYEAVIREARNILGEDLYVIMEDYMNDRMKQIIGENFLPEDIFINTWGSNLNDFLLRHRNKKGVIFGEILGMQIEHYVDNRNIVIVCGADNSDLLLPDTKRIVVSNREKAEKAVEVMEELIQLKYDAKEDKCVYVRPK